MASETESKAACGAAAAGLSEMPSTAFGTMEYVDGSCGPEELQAAVTAAITAGYRHVDCAELYESTPHVGGAIAASPVPRDELWVTSKLKGMPNGAYADVLARAQAHAKALNIGSFDLLLMHWPGPDTADFGGTPQDFAAACSWEWFSENVGSAWANMQRLVEDGVARRVGVSNFTCAHLDALAKACPDAPAPYANQVYIDAVHQQDDVLARCTSAGIRVMGYRPLAFVQVYAMAEAMGDGTNAALTAAATASGAATAQALVLGWLHARGVVTIAKSRSPEHIAANLAASTGAAGLTVDATTLDGVPAVAGMIDMLGGCDEYAVAMMGIGPPAESGASAAAAAATGGGDGGDAETKQAASGEGASA